MAALGVDVTDDRHFRIEDRLHDLLHGRAQTARGGETDQEELALVLVGLVDGASDELGHDGIDDSIEFEFTLFDETAKSAFKKGYKDLDISSPHKSYVVLLRQQVP